MTDSILDRLLAVWSLKNVLPCESKHSILHYGLFAVVRLEVEGHNDCCWQAGKPSHFHSPTQQQPSHQMRHSKLLIFYPHLKKDIMRWVVCQTQLDLCTNASSTRLKILELSI